MKRFDAPEMEVVMLEVTDVITTSVELGENQTPGRLP